MASLERRDLIRALVRRRKNPPKPRVPRRAPRTRADIQQRQNERRAAWKAQGKCMGCGRDPVPGIRRCQPCRDSHRAWGKKSYEKHRADGKCHQCGGQALQDQTQCAKCAEQNRLYAKARRERAKEQQQ